MSQADIYKAAREAFPAAAQVGVEFRDDSGLYASWYDVRPVRQGETGAVTVTVQSPERVK